MCACCLKLSRTSHEQSCDKKKIFTTLITQTSMLHYEDCRKQAEDLCAGSLIKRQSKQRTRNTEKRKRNMSGTATIPFNNSQSTRETQGL